MFTLIAEYLAMKHNRHAREQVTTILNANEHGLSITASARQNRVTEQTLYRWTAT